MGGAPSRASRGGGPVKKTSGCQIDMGARVTIFNFAPGRVVREIPGWEILENIQNKEKKCGHSTLLW